MPLDLLYRYLTEDLMNSADSLKNPKLVYVLASRKSLKNAIVYRKNIHVLIMLRWLRWAFEYLHGLTMKAPPGYD